MVTLCDILGPLFGDRLIFRQKIIFMLVLTLLEGQRKYTLDTDGFNRQTGFLLHK